MSRLILGSLEIRAFRPFEHLRVEALGRVNLITGKNNVGKSCLLEALRLYATRAHPAVIIDLLRSRDERVRTRREIPTTAEAEDWDSVLRSLFHGRRSLTESIESIQIGPINSPDERLALAVKWYRFEVVEQERRRVEVPIAELGVATDATLGIVVQLGNQQVGVYLPERSWLREFPGWDAKGLPSAFISANGLTKNVSAQMWDTIALTDLEEDVLAALRIIAPTTERVNLIGPKGEVDRFQDERVPMVRMQGVSSPMPLRSLGEGMNRLFGIALALLNARDGLLLIDEVESGLHYSVQPDLWRLIFRVARRLNVQVFATSHSWDCIEGFQAATQQDGEDEGLLIRLERRQDDVVATVFDAQSLGIATREQIEVR